MAGEGIGPTLTRAKALGVATMFDLKCFVLPANKLLYYIHIIYSSFYLDGSRFTSALGSAF
jgi:hypothetical protein